MTQNQAKTGGVVIENLSLSFGDTAVLKGVNLTIKEGEFFAFLGPSGSGKSTLLRAIAGFGPTPKGRILVNGQDVADLPPWKRNVGMVFQSYALWPHMTVRRNVAFGLEERRVPKREIEERVRTALEMVGLQDYADRRPSQLSGGQQQRIALARTIVVEPKVLLLDEPLSNLDANLRLHMRHEIRELQQKLKLTTIFVTHDQEEANSTSDRLAVLEGGVIQQVGAPVELYDRPANLFVAKFLGAANVIEGVIEAGGSAPAFKARNGVTVPLAAGDSARHMVFRPQNVRVLPRTAEQPADEILMPGRILRREFLGGIVRYGIDSGGELILVDDPHGIGQAVFDVGTEVALALRTDQVTFLAA